MNSAAGVGDDSSATTATEFVIEEFDTTVSEDAVENLTRTIEQVVSDLRTRTLSDDRLETLLRGQPGHDVLHSNDITEQGDPEPFTQRRVIEPLFEALGYPDFTTEASGLSDQQRQKADYLFSLREFDAIESKRLPVEAEPLNKNLHQQNHGVGQVEGWLDSYSFGAEFGIATDGMRWVLIKYDRERYQYDTLAEVNLQPVFIAAFENLTGRQVSLSEWVDEETDALLDGFVQSFSFENFVTIASDARSVIEETKSAITDEFYNEYVRRVFGVVEEGEDERTAFSLVGDGIVAPEAATGDDIRLFAVEIMNRLIFIKFLEDKHVVESDLLRALWETYEDGVYPDTFYGTFLERLFYDVFDTKPEQRTRQVQSVELFDGIPYLDGGLFRPRTSGWDGEGIEESGFDVRDSVLESLIGLLERYEFSADGGPRDLDPSVLGNVFEKTINYITTDPGDRNKELGAYYTPDEITRFCAERTVRPALFARFKRVLHEERGWPEAEVERYDGVESLIEDLPPSEGLIHALLDATNSLRVVDPACGSGHFLTSTLEEIVSVRRALYARIEATPPGYRLKKTTVLENIYGVDIVDPAVEIAKLRMWLATIAELDEETAETLDADELALPNIAFNVRQGNSLIGYTGFPEQTDDGEFTLERWSEESVRNRYEEIIEEKRRFREAVTRKQANEHQQRAFALLEESRGELHENVLRDFERAGVEGLTKADVAAFDPFHWVLEFAEVYAKGGFDVVVGNPPWDVLRTNRDDYFAQFDAEFRSRMPEDKDQMMEQLLEGEEIADGWDEYRREMQARADYFNDSDEYELQSPTVDGRRVTAENDLSMLFAERAFKIAREGGHVSLVLPNVIFTGSSAKDLRQHLLDGATVDSILHFENHGIFDEIDTRYRFGILTFQNSGHTEGLRGIFFERNLDIFEQFNEKTVTIPRDVLQRYSPEAALFPQISSRNAQDAVAGSRQEVDVLEAILSHPPLEAELSGKWTATSHRELDRTYDADRFVESATEGDYPVYGGKNVYQFVHDERYLGVKPPELWSVEESENPELSAKNRIREKEVKNLKSALYDALDGTGTQKRFVNEVLNEHRGEPLSPEDVLLDCTEYRIVFRDIANTTNERTFIATVIPPGTVCHSKLRTIRPYHVKPEESDLSEKPLHSVYKRTHTDKELFVILGLLNSIPFDHLMRTKVDNVIVDYKFRESQVPRLTAGDDWFEYIWRRAARLNCYGEAFAEMRERLGNIDPATDETKRRQLQAEIDAAAFHAYGLDRKETRFVLDDFHRVRNPRLMTEDYFARVLDEYDTLAESSPTP